MLQGKMLRCLAEMVCVLINCSKACEGSGLSFLCMLLRHSWGMVMSLEPRWWHVKECHRRRVTTAFILPHKCLIHNCWSIERWHRYSFPLASGRFGLHVLVDVLSFNKCSDLALCKGILVDTHTTMESFLDFWPIPPDSFLPTTSTTPHGICDRGYDPGD